MELENLTSVFLYFLSIGVLSNLEAVKPFYRILIWIGMAVFSSLILSLVMYSEDILFSWVFMSCFWALFTILFVLADIMFCFMFLRDLLTSLLKYLILNPVVEIWEKFKSVVARLFKMDPDEIDFMSIAVILSLAIVISVLYYNVNQPV